jgi:hypothetical protein
MARSSSTSPGGPVRPPALCPTSSTTRPGHRGHPYPRGERHRRPRVRTRRHHRRAHPALAPQQLRHVAVRPGRLGTVPGEGRVPTCAARRRALARYPGAGTQLPGPSRRLLGPNRQGAHPSRPAAHPPDGDGGPGHGEGPHGRPHGPLRRLGLGALRHVTPSMRQRLRAGLTAQWESALDTRLCMHPTSPVDTLDRLLCARTASRLTVATDSDMRRAGSRGGNRPSGCGDGEVS